MGKITKPKLVRLVIGLLSENAELAKQVSDVLEKKYGSLDACLEPFKFEWTNYYEDELGSNPVRSFLSFERLIDREEVVDIKQDTNELELELFDGKRSVNLDPGYMTLGQFFLATTKDQRQRVYIKDGIFVEPTLYFQNGHFHNFDWTYRDYQSDVYIKYLEKVRQQYAYQLKSNKPYSQRLNLK